MRTYRTLALLGSLGLALGLGGAAFAQGAFDLMKSLTDKAAQSVLPPKPTPAAATAGQTGDEYPATVETPLGRQSLEPMGYSLRFLDVRGRIEQGDFPGALQMVAPPEAGGAGSPFGHDPFLTNAEAGLIAFDAGRFEDAAASLTQAEAAVAPPRPGETQSGVEKVANGVGGFFRRTGAVVSGQGEFGPYARRDHEAILQLNYLALAYLIQGDRRSYNVTRRAIARQKDLKAQFDAEIGDYKTRYAAEKRKATAAQQPTMAGSMAGLETEIAAYSKAGELVPNAYVNPLGDYLAAVIQEIAAAEEPSLRDNARIAFTSAQALAGQSPQMAAAAAALARSNVPASERVLHLVVGEGFAPSRQVLAYGFNWEGTPLTARVPIFTAVPSQVASIEVRTAKGRLARLDPIGNFEAIVMRDQQDRLPQILLGVAATTAASYTQARAGARMGGIGARVVGFKRDAETPDTRSWSSLPRRFHAGRITLPPGARSVQLVSLNAAGKVLSTTTVTLDPAKPQSFVYARATDQGLSAVPARALWIDGRLEGL